MICCLQTLLYEESSTVKDEVTEKPAEEKPTEEKPAEEKPTEEKPVEESKATPEMDFDLGGRTIKVVAWWDMSITGEDPASVKRRENLEALMKKHNFKIEYQAIDYGEYHDKLIASLMAGQPIGDIVRIGKSFMIPTLVKQDFFWPIEEEWIKNDRVFNQKYTKEFFQYKGKGYAFSNAADMATGIIYNKTLMKKLGLKPLQQYVDEDKWTWDTFIEVAKSANRDTDNDGKIDTWGLASGGFLEQALAANETDLVAGDKQNLDDPRVIEALNFISRLHTEGVPRPSEGGDWREPRNFFVQGNTLMYAGADWEIGGLKNDMPDYELGFLPFPKGPSASGYHACEPLVQAIAIPKAVSNARELVYIWEKIYDIPDELREEYPNQNWYESLFEDEADINNLRMAAAGMRITDRASYPSLPYWDFLGELTSGVSVSTLIEKYKAPFQAAIDEVWKK
ncbi:ABC-type glycerol-3-phosphate transport system substrate-binding protein [Caldicoprobacter guelmensis]|uniref:ABC transporter substrate-binding protein n=1 Tax=Caldicoprobacter guelmensis TaxID=1170224 RepID=UPI001958B06C|nr:extracellular solute-binding protein [Caldicoprobacter guelmensis]MBM7582113.1 ABC-type glycerol-3-phosphate transport system substrate-binding protein [Caldicoprobacter guelmensis]